MKLTGVGWIEDWNIGIMERWNDGGRTITQNATHLQVCAKLCKFMQNEADGIYELRDVGVDSEQKSFWCS